jgi:hypothetical protein
MPILYGSKIAEEKYFDGRTVLQCTRYNESIKVRDTKKALAEFLNLLDLYNAGKISDFSINCIADVGGKIIRVEKSWVIPDLQ